MKIVVGAAWQEGGSMLARLRGEAISVRLFQSGWTRDAGLRRLIHMGCFMPSKECIAGKGGHAKHVLAPQTRVDPCLWRVFEMIHHGAFYITLLSIGAPSLLPKKPPELSCCPVI
jgi:hypothetical protein